MNTVENLMKYVLAFQKCGNRMGLWRHSLAFVWRSSLPPFFLGTTGDSSPCALDTADEPFPCVCIAISSRHPSVTAVCASLHETVLQHLQRTEALFRAHPNTFPTSHTLTRRRGVACMDDLCCVRELYLHGELIRSFALMINS